MMAIVLYFVCLLGLRVLFLDGAFYGYISHKRQAGRSSVRNVMHGIGSLRSWGQSAFSSLVRLTGLGHVWFNGSIPSKGSRIVVDR